MTEMSTCDKDFKAAIINSAQISNYEHAQNKGKKSLSKETESHRKEIEDMKQPQMELLKLEHTITENKILSR